LTASKTKPAAKKVTKQKHKYRLKFLPDALDEFQRLDGSVRSNLKKVLAKRLDKPHVPGGELHGDLVNCYKIKLRKQGVRLVYQVEDDALVVLVLAVDRREDNAAYRSAIARLVDAANAVAVGQPPQRTRHGRAVPLPDGAAAGEEHRPRLPARARLNACRNASLPLWLRAQAVTLAAQP